MSQEEIKESNIVHLWLGIALGIVVTIGTEFTTVWLLGWI